MLRRLAALSILALVTAAPAVAGDIHVSFAIAPGTLGVAAAPTTLGGTVAVPLVVSDGRGNGAGWSLRLAGAGSPQVTSVSVRCAAGSTCTLPATRLAFPRTVGTTPTRVFGALRASGMGRFQITLTVTGGHGPLAVSVVSG